MGPRWQTDIPTLVSTFLTVKFWIVDRWFSFYGWDCPDECPVHDGFRHMPLCVTCICVKHRISRKQCHTALERETEGNKLLLARSLPFLCFLPARKSQLTFRWPKDKGRLNLARVPMENVNSRRSHACLLARASASACYPFSREVERLPFLSFLVCLCFVFFRWSCYFFLPS